RSPVRIADERRALQAGRYFAAYVNPAVGRGALRRPICLSRRSCVGSRKARPADCCHFRSLVWSLHCDASANAIELQSDESQIRETQAWAKNSFWRQLRHSRDLPSLSPTTRASSRRKG